MSRQISALDAFISPTYPFVLATPDLLPLRPSHPFITISFSFPLISSYTSLAHSVFLFLQPQSFPFSYLVLFIPGEKPPATSIGFTDGPSTSFASPAFSIPSLLRLPFLPSRSCSSCISSLSFLIRAKRFGFSLSFSLSSRRHFLHQPEQTPRPTSPVANICSHLSAYWGLRRRPVAANEIRSQQHVGVLAVPSVKPMLLEID